MDVNVNLRAEARKRLVDAVVENLVDQVVKTADIRAPDVHVGALAHRVETLENANVVGTVLLETRVAYIVREIGPGGISYRDWVLRSIVRQIVDHRSSLVLGAVDHVDSFFRQIYPSVSKVPARKRISLRLGKPSSRRSLSSSSRR